MAATTVGYGWQPDNQGGLEYIVQIPPGQLEDGGEITSRIDPRVRGLVSRVVVRVGDGPVPREYGDLAPNTLASVANDAAGTIQQVTETQASQVAELNPIVRGQSGGSNAGGYSMPSTVNNLAQRGQQFGNGVTSAIKDTYNNAVGSPPSSNYNTAGTSRPSTNYSSTGATPSTNYNAAGSPASTNYNNGTSLPAYRNGETGIGNQGMNDSRQFVGPTRDGYNAGGQYNGGQNAGNQYSGINNSAVASNQNNDPQYRDSSWTTGSSPARPRPSTSAYDSNNNSNAQQYARGTSTFANPNYTARNDSQYTSGDPYGQNNRPDTNLSNVDTNQPRYPSTYDNQQRDQRDQRDQRGGEYDNNRFAQNDRSDDFYNRRQDDRYQRGYNNRDDRSDYNQNPNVGPMRDGYVPAQGNYNNYGANGLTAAGLAGIHPYAMGGNVLAGNGLTPNAAGLNLAALYGANDPRYLLAASNGFYNQSPGGLAGDKDRSDTEGKASAILIAERERLSTQAMELRRENEKLARTEKMLTDDNETLIYENTQAKTRLQSMSFFQFFLMISFLANVYLIVHLVKLLQRYRDLVTTVRSASSTTQTA